MRTFAAAAITALSALLPLASGAAEPGDVIFSELMWMGSSASSADEWIELYNRTDAAVDLSGWTITKGADEPQVMLTIESGSIGAQAVFLIANYAADNSKSALAAVPDLVDAAVSLPNSKLQLRLYDGDPEAGATLIDIADDGTGAPLGGDKDALASMVRLLQDGDGTVAESWGTATDQASWDGSGNELGTPGQGPDGPGSAEPEPAPQPEPEPPQNPEPEPTSTTAVQRSSWAAVKRDAAQPSH